MSSIAAGDSQAFDQLFREMYPALCYVARQLGISDHIARDIASDVFLQLWNHRDRLEHIREPRAYLYASTRNRSLNYLKHMEMDLLHQQKAMEERTLSITEEDVLQAIYDQETVRLLKKAIDSLPPECALVVNLSLQGYNTTEIAQQLNISLSAVSNQKARAIRLLKERISLSLCFAVIMLIHP